MANHFITVNPAQVRHGNFSVYSVTCPSYSEMEHGVRTACTV